MKKKTNIAAGKKKKSANGIDKDLLQSKNLLKLRINALKKIQKTISESRNDNKVIP